MIRDGDAPRLVLAVSERDHHLGSPAPLVTLVEYGDYECPFSARAHEIVQDLRARLGDQLRFVYRHFPLVRKHPHSRRAAEAVECASAQGTFWPMHDLLFGRAGALSDGALVGLAAELGLDLDRFVRELAEGTYREHVDEDVMSGVRSGVAGTPTFFVDGELHDASWDYVTLLATLERRIVAKQRRAA